MNIPILIMMYKYSAEYGRFGFYFHFPVRKDTQRRFCIVALDVATNITEAMTNHSDAYYYRVNQFDIKIINSTLTTSYHYQRQKEY